MISSSADHSSSVVGKRFSEENSQNLTNTPVTSKAPSAELPPEERNRGKRMMGVLMGTLSKFKSEEVDKSEANLKRILLEQRLAQKLSQAKEQLSAQQTAQATGPVVSDQVPELSAAEVESRRVYYASQIFPAELNLVKRESVEACAQFQQTVTLPVLYFKRAQ